MKLLNAALKNYSFSRENQDWIRKVFEANNYPFDRSSNWCGLFMGYLVKTIGFENPINPETARHWLKVGKPVTTPEPGDICVLWRESKRSWKGHVGIYINQVGETLYLLGGNQGSRRKVQVSSYPQDRLLGYRRLL